MSTFVCPTCDHQQDVPEHFAGKKAKCPKCGTSAVIPNVTEPYVSPSPEPAEPQAIVPHVSESEVTVAPTAATRIAKQPASVKQLVFVLLVLQLCSAIVGWLQYTHSRQVASESEGFRRRVESEWREFQTKQSKAPRWEYKIAAPHDALFTLEMDNLGRDGWEVVSARRATDSATDRASYEMILKRKIP